MPYIIVTFYTSADYSGLLYYEEEIIVSKSNSAKLMSEVLELFSMFMDKNGEKLIEDALQKGEKPSTPPLVPKTRIEDYENGRVFYANEDSKSGITVFYLHGGAYFMDLRYSSVCSLRSW